jgi:transposase
MSAGENRIRGESIPVKKQGRYAAKRVKDLNFERLCGLGEKVLVAIDVAKREQYVAFVGGSGPAEAMLLGKWTHPAETPVFFGLCEKLREAGKELVVVMEPSGTYGDPLLSWFWSKGIEVRRVLGKQVYDGSAMLDGTMSGHDAKSTVMLAAIYKLGGSREWKAPSESARRLRALASEHAWFDGLCRQLRGMMEGILARHWPELTGILKPRAKVFWQLLEETGGPKRVRDEPEWVAALMRRSGRDFLLPAKITAVISSAETLGMPMLPEESSRLSRLAAEYRRASNEREGLAAQLAVMVSAVTTAGLVELLGPAAVAHLIALNLDPLDFAHPKAFVKALGLGLKEKSSGSVQGRLRITKRGSPRARWLMVMAALRLIARDPVVRAWHFKKRERDGHKERLHNGLISATAVARKLAQAAWHVARGQDFDASKLFDVSRLDVPTVVFAPDIGSEGGDDHPLDQDDVLEVTSTRLARARQPAMPSQAQPPRVQAAPESLEATPTGRSGARLEKRISAPARGEQQATSPGGEI